MGQIDCVKIETNTTFSQDGGSTWLGSTRGHRILAESKTGWLRSTQLVLL